FVAEHGVSRGHPAHCSPPPIHPSCPRIARRKTRVNALLSRAPTSWFRTGPQISVSCPRKRESGGHGSALWVPATGSARRKRRRVPLAGTNGHRHDRGLTVT